MSKLRWWILIVGPPAILAVSFAPEPHAARRAARTAGAESFSDRQAEAADLTDHRGQDEHLAAACRQVDARLCPAWAAECHSIVRLAVCSGRRFGRSGARRLASRDDRAGDARDVARAFGHASQRADHGAAVVRRIELQPLR